MQVPQSTFASSVFEAIVTIPIDYPLQINGFGKLTPINVGGVIILPNSFRIHPNNATNGANNNLVNIYSNNYPNIVVIGPLPASKYSSMTFAINSPTVTDILNGNINYGKHPIYFGGNRGRGQLYADGTKSNNTIYTSNINGIIKQIHPYQLYTDIIINNIIEENNIIVEKIIQIPKGPAIIVNEGDVVELDQPLTTNPNVGGFGQVEKQIVLQDAKRVQIQIAFIFIITIAQISLVIKKKQYETTLLTQRY